MPSCLKTGGGEIDDGERTWLGITEERGAEIYRKLTLLSHLIMPKLGTQAGYTREYQPPVPVSPHKGKQEQKKGWHPKKRENSSLRRKGGEGQEKLGFQRGA